MTSHGMPSGAAHQAFWGQVSAVVYGVCAIQYVVFKCIHDRRSATTFGTRIRIDMALIRT